MPPVLERGAGGGESGGIHEDVVGVVSRDGEVADLCGGERAEDRRQDAHGVERKRSDELKEPSEQRVGSDADGGDRALVTEALERAVGLLD